MICLQSVDDVLTIYRQLLADKTRRQAWAGRLGWKTGRRGSAGRVGGKTGRGGSAARLDANLDGTLDGTDRAGAFKIRTTGGM
jgi:hypothetical protein